MVYVLLFNIDTESNCGWIIGGEGGQRVCCPPSKIIGGGGGGLHPHAAPPLSYAYESIVMKLYTNIHHDIVYGVPVLFADLDILSDW